MTLPGAPATAGQPVGKTRTSVLVVEDDAGIATQLVRGLRRAGTTWTTSRPGARRCAGESLGGRAARWLLLTASLLTGLLFAVVTVHLAGPWAAVTGA